VRRRHHLEESVVQRAVKAAVRAAHIEKHAGCHTLRHCAARGVMPTHWMNAASVLKSMILRAA
jgi:integrase